MDNIYTDNVVHTSSAPMTTIKNVLELIESNPTITDLYYRMSGYAKSAHKGNTIVVRQRPPRFTDEFTEETVMVLRSFSNPVTAQTDWGVDDIKLHLRDMGHSLIEFFATKGDDNYISEYSWAKIIDKHRTGKTVEQGKNQIYVSGWYKDLNYNWDRHKPVSIQMLQSVKDRDEDADQFIVMREIFWQIYPFLDASLRRSWDALTLKHHQEVIKETHVQQERQKKSNMLQSMTRGFSGGGKEQ